MCATMRKPPPIMVKAISTASLEIPSGRITALQSSVNPITPSNTMERRPCFRYPGMNARRPIIIKARVRPMWVPCSVAASIGRDAANKGVKMQCKMHSMEVAMPALSQLLTLPEFKTLVYMFKLLPHKLVIHTPVISTR